MRLLGFRIQGLGFSALGKGFQGSKISRLGLGISDLAFNVQCPRELADRGLLYYAHEKLGKTHKW